MRTLFHAHFTGLGQDVSAFADLVQLCKLNDIPYLFEEPTNRIMSTEFFRRYDLDIIYCIGWSYLLSKDLLDLTPQGVIGFHPAKLPANRGRHPIIWALVLGLNETASTFFKMDESADSGPILSQELVPIDAEDNATSLYKKIIITAKKQIIDFTNQLTSGTAVFNEQSSDLATYWRKRCKEDGLIDWRMSATAIHNLVRALTFPYSGAEFILRDKLVPVFCSTIDLNTYAENIEPGKVLSIKGTSILVKCYGINSIWLHNLNEDQLPIVGEYL